MDHKQRVLFLTFSFAALALFAGLRGYLTAFLAALLVFTAIGLAFVWNRFVFRKLHLKRSLNRTYAEFDSLITMELAITNRKVLPLLGLKLESTVTSGLEFADSRRLLTERDGRENIFQDFFHLNWYEKRTRRYELRPLKRGRYEFGQGTLSYADPFGFFANQLEDVLETEKITVFPKIVPIQGQTGLNTYLFGSRPREGWIYTDPLNLVGTRPYQTTDSARQINWKATARHGAMQVDIEKPSFDQQVYLVLLQPPQAKWWVSAVNNNLEVAIMAAASLIDNYLQAGYQINLATNLISRIHGLEEKPSRLIAGRSQRVELLTRLALLHNFSMEPDQRVLARIGKRMEPGCTAVVITTAPGKLEPALAGSIRRLMARGRVGVLRVSAEKELKRTAGLREWRIEGRRPWREAASLELS